MEQLCRVGLSLSDAMGIFSSNETNEENDFKYHISLNAGLRNVFIFYSFTKFVILGLLTDFQMEPDKLTMQVLTTSQPATKWKFWPPRQKICWSVSSEPVLDAVGNCCHVALDYIDLL